MKNVWEQKQEESGQIPKANFGQSLVIWIGSVVLGTIALVAVQIGMMFLFGMRANFALQLWIWVALSVLSVWPLAAAWKKRASVFVYVLAGVGGAMIHFTGVIR